METRHWIIRGKVQGVGFRASTVSTAQQLNLKGWVRNLTTGEVEVLAQGHSNVLDRLNYWLHQGSSAAQVEQVISTLVPEQNLLSFRTKSTASKPQSFEDKR